MEFYTKKVIVNSKKYGELEIAISKKTKLGNLYLATVIYNDITMFGLITETGEEIVPIDKINLLGLQFFNDGKDMLFEFKHNHYKTPEYLHIRNYSDGKSKIIFKTDYKSKIPVTIGLFEDTEDYWLIEMGEENDKKVAIYDYKENKMLSTFLDEVAYQDDGFVHKFYYSLAIETLEKQPNGFRTPQIHTSICGFLDEKGDLSSQIYDTESNVFYSSYMYGPNTLSSKFNELVQSLTHAYANAYFEKSEHVDEVLSYMYENPNMSEKPENYTEGKKILEFKPRKNV